MTGNVTYSDNVKAQFGTSQDLQIYHNGFNSFIDDTGTGSLFIRADATIEFKSLAQDEYYIKCVENDTVQLYNNGSVKLATTSTGIDVTGRITTDGLTTSADINFGDDDKALFGASNDLKIYHSANNQSYIHEVGSGDLNILASNFKIQNGAGTENKIVANTDGAVSLYYDNAAKLATTSTGINVTGTVTSDGLILDTNTSLYQTDATLSSYSSTNGVYLNGHIGGWLRLNGDRTGNQRFDIFGNNGGGYIRALTQNKNRLDIANNGDISFYENTGTTAKLFWDASAERLGLGTSSPSHKLTVEGTTSHTTTRVKTTTGNANLRVSTNNSDFAIIGQGGSNRLDIYDNNASSTRLSLDSSGNLLVGTTSTNPQSSSSVEGVQIAPDHIGIGRNGNTVLYLNRQTNDGSIISLRKAGSEVGSINTINGDINIGTGDTGFRFHDGSDYIEPYNISTNSFRDNAISLGTTGSRFKDLHLSGTANFGSLSDGTITITGFVDEDNMSSNSATLVPTQQSVKAYVDSQVSSAGGNGISFSDNEKAQFGAW